MKAVHFTEKFNCDDCKKVFNSSEVLETHCRNAHQVKVGTGPILFHNLEAPKSERWFPCNQCDYKSKLKANTEKHKKIHLKSWQLVILLVTSTLRGNFHPSDLRTHKV